MLLVINPNPAVDRVAVVDFRNRETLRPVRSFEWPGGSGTHAAHVARRLGAEVEVIAPIGGLYGQRYKDLAARHGLVVHEVPIEGETRGTYSVIDRTRGNICDIAEVGPAVSQSLNARFLATVANAMPRASLMVISGSAPPGLHDSFYPETIRIASGFGVRTIADLTASSLLAAMSDPPWMLKPSLEELQRDGIIGSSARDILRVAEDWHQQGVAHVCISLAGAGLLWVSKQGAKRVKMRSVTAAYNTIGAGDTLVGAIAGGTLAGRGLEESLRLGMAAATVNLSYDEPGECTPEEVAALLPETSIEVVDEMQLEDMLGFAA